MHHRSAVLAHIILTCLCCVASAAPFYRWVEAESLGGWTQVAGAECSAGAFVAGNVASGFCGDFIPLPIGDRFWVWVRYCEAQEGGRRGHVVVNGTQSELLGGKGGGRWVWRKVGQFSGDGAGVRLIGADPWPSEVYIDCLLFTTDAQYSPPDRLPASGRFDHEAFVPASEPRVAYLYPDYEYSGYSPRDEWDADFAALGWRADKYEVGDCAALWEGLASYDVLLVGSLATALGDEALVAAGPAIRDWLSSGGLLVYSDCNHPAHESWIEAAGLGRVEVRTGGDGRPRSFGFAADGALFATEGANWAGEDRPWTYCRHQSPGFPPVRWRCLSASDPAWRTFAQGDAGPLGLARRLGDGLAVVTCLYKGLGLGKDALLRIFLGARSLSGRPTLSRIVTPSDGPPLFAAEGARAVRLVDIGPGGVSVRDDPAAPWSEESLTPGEHRYSLYLSGTSAAPELRIRHSATVPPALSLPPLTHRRGDRATALPDLSWYPPADFDAASASGTLRVLRVPDHPAPDAPPAEGTLVMALTWQGMSPEGSTALPVFETSLAPGRYRLVAEGRASRTGAVTGLVRRETVAAEGVLVVHAPTTDRPANVGYDSRGISVDGRRFFPFGFFAVHRESIPLLFEGGFNAICGGGGREYLDEALRNGIRVFGSCSWDLGALDESVAALADHPALIGYYVMDEPSNSGHTIDQLRRMNAIVAGHDPQRPKFFIDNDALEFPSCIPQVDIIMLDPYCIRGPQASLERIAFDIGYSRELSSGDKPVFVILQAHPFGGQDLTMPTPAQIRAETYLAITEGARGVFYFLFEEIDGLDGIHNPDGGFEQPQWQEMRRIATELGGLQEALFAEHQEVETGDARVRASARRCEKEDVVFVVNQTAETVGVQLALPGLAQAPESLQCGPYEVRILRYPKGGD